MKNFRRRIPLPLLLFFSSQLMGCIAKRIITPILPIYVRDFGFSIAELGIISAGFGVGLMIFEPLWGILADKVRPKKIFTVSLSFSPLIMFSYTLVGDLATFTALMFFSGVWECAFGVSSRMLAREAISKGGRAFGAWFTIFSAAELIGPVLGGYTAITSYNLTFYVGTVIALIAFFLSFGASTSESTHLASKQDRPKGLDKEEKTTLIITSSLIILPWFLIFVYRTFLPVFAKEELLLNPLEIGLIFAVISVVGIFASMLFGGLSDRVGRKKIIVLGMLLQAFSFLLLPISSSTMLLVLTAIILGVGIAAINPAMMALLTEKIPISKQGLALGVYGSGEDVGIWIGPLIVGYIYQNYGAEVSFYITAGLMFFNLILSILLLKNTNTN